MDNQQQPAHWTTFAASGGASMQMTGFNQRGFDGGFGDEDDNNDYGYQEEGEQEFEDMIEDEEAVLQDEGGAMYQSCEGDQEMIDGMGDESDQVKFMGNEDEDDEESKHSEYEGAQQEEEEERAINLIVYDQQRGFYVSDEAKAMLSNIKEKIGIIAVAGKYRTGKSFLLNRIILNKTDQSGFGVGPTINPCTKGLWIWNKPISVDKQGGEAPYKVLIVDSEGIGAFNEDQNHDTRIFLLALLLSSYFIYNSMGTIDESALQNLSLIVNLSKQLQIKNSKAEDADPDEVAQYFPSFLWVVRDFSLKLLDQYGNQINSKEYLENALKEQKGTSDNIEKKNRIRRLIVNFFKDRDCYTMVRPTEEERDLQALQKLQDNRLRPEFVEQMTQLRSRIFKRVKPKVLNGKYLTGEMFLELCLAYTEAINKGQVPCIESAWTYLCQNECLRAMQDAINGYESQMRQVVFLNKKMTDCQPYPKVKEAHQRVREQCLIQFKEKAVGENSKEFEGKILEEIQKKYVSLKQRCLQIYQKKCHEAIAKQLETLESKVRQEQYEQASALLNDIEGLKENYQNATAEITYSQKEVVIKSICEKLLIKGFESIQRKDKEQASNLNRQLVDKVNYLEKNIAERKEEYDSERTGNQTKLLQLQTELQQLRSTSMISEEKLKLLEADQQRKDSHAQSQLKALTLQKEQIENTLTLQLKEAKQKLRILEESQTKSQLSFEKEAALKDQKLAFVDQETKRLHQRVEELAQDNKELSKRLQESESELKQVEIQLKLKEEEKRKEQEVLKEHYKKRVEEASKKGSADSTVVADLEKQKGQWEQERQFLQEQLQFSQRQIEENKVMHEALLKAINQRGANKEQDELQIMQVNKTLSETIAQVEVRNQQLQTKLSTIKLYQRVFKHQQNLIVCCLEVAGYLVYYKIYFINRLPIDAVQILSSLLPCRDFCGPRQNLHKQELLFFPFSLLPNSTFSRDQIDSCRQRSHRQPTVYRVCDSRVVQREGVDCEPKVQGILFTA